MHKSFIKKISNICNAKMKCKSYVTCLYVTNVKKKRKTSLYAQEQNNKGKAPIDVIH